MTVNGKHKNSAEEGFKTRRERRNKQKKKRKTGRKRGKQEVWKKGRGIFASVAPHDLTSNSENDQKKGSAEGTEHYECRLC